MGIDIRQLGPDAQRQVREQLAKEDKRRRTRKLTVQLDEFDSNLERDYYLAEILPCVQRGEIEELELHKTFVLLEAAEFCGLKLPRIVYTPDFYIKFADGRIMVVETKHRKIKRLQRDYGLRRRLFIEQYAKPCGWTFREIIYD